MNQERAKKIVSFLEKNEIDSETSSAVINILNSSTLLADILLLTLKKGWSVSELKQAANMILTLQDN